MKRNIVKLTKSTLATIISALTILLVSCNKKDEEITQKSLQEGVQEPKTETPQIPNTEVPNPFLKELEAVFIEGGSFIMGSPTKDKESQGDERPQHKVTVSDFKVSKYEITNSQYAKFLTAKGNQIEDKKKWYQGRDIKQEGDSFVVTAGKENHPVVFVSWYGAKAYAEWVGGKLPTEAEFEYILRGGNKKVNQDGIFADEDGSGDDIGDYAWYRANSGGRLHPVGEKKANELGLHDVNGNVWEWTADWYGHYSGDDQTNPTGPERGTYRVRRGASYTCLKDKCRIANRGAYVARGGQGNIGFRVAFPAK
ncbi:formylglycine-generating enzyme family protein [Capnocytophaga cynodegmi]|uniref:formylglycine-generating enzyme family protein n=1 Tax=Capnocytophaga cynodegmi TaxID=28189 RepID=UPI00385F1B45